MHLSAPIQEISKPPLNIVHFINRTYRALLRLWRMGDTPIPIWVYHKMITIWIFLKFNILPIRIEIAKSRREKLSFSVSIVS